MQTQSIDKQEIIQATDECVMCGLCLPHCPTYNTSQIESESPRGRIALVRALYEEQLTADKFLHHHLENCLHCLNCQQACPANVDYEKIIDAGRAKTTSQSNGLKNIQQSIVLLILSNQTARKLFKHLITAIRKLGLLNLLPKKRITQLLVENKHSFKSVNTPGTGWKVAVVESCADDLLCTQTTSAVTSLLHKLGCEVVKQKKVNCCGALHQHCGLLDKAQILKQSFTNSFKSNRVNFIISTSTGCGAHIKSYADELDQKVVDINDFLLKHVNLNELSFKPLNKKVFLHKPCTQKQVCDQADAVEQLLGHIPEINLIHLFDPTGCCGAGGMNSVLNASLANQLITNMVEEIRSAEPAWLVSSNIGCTIHIQSRLKQENIPVHVGSPAAILAEQML